jgi:quercetin dioxygenase-like cupin family protein
MPPPDVIVPEPAVPLPGPFQIQVQVRSEHASGVLAVIGETLAPRILVPNHVHRNDVWVRVESGEIGVLVGDEVRTAGAGEWALKPRDIEHAMWNPADEPARVTEVLTPGGSERWFEELAALADEDDAGFADARADEFRLHVPDGDGPLSYGRAEFLALPRVRVAPWDGMRGAVEITGPLTPAGRELFLRLEPSVESFDPEHKLWDYRLLRGGTVILSVSDYHDLQVGVPAGGLPGGQDDRPAVGDGDGVLDVGGPGAVGGADRPPVLVQVDAVAAARDEPRLDG